MSDRPPAIRTRGLYRRPMRSDAYCAALRRPVRSDAPCFNRQLPTGNPALCAQARRGLPERYPGFPDPALYPDIAEADCRLVVMHSAQRDGIATRTGHLRPEDALDEIVRFFEARVSACDGAGSLPTGSSSIQDGIFLEPAPETSLHVLSNLQKLKSALGLPLLVSVSRKSFLERHR